MKKILVLALFGLLFAVTTTAGNVGNYFPDVGIEQVVMFVQPVSNFQVETYVVDLPVFVSGIFLPENTTTVVKTFDSDSWRNPDWGPSLAIMCNANLMKSKDGYTVQKIPILTYRCNWENRTIHNYNINYSYGLRI
ncbi:MAG TPA: hypothetical protein P5084_15695 [Paludibacter sp.]|nr:hypothetical protein [Paludibacter sp.]